MNVISEKRVPVVSKEKIQQENKLVNICPNCKNVHYKSVWYAPDSRLALLLDTKKDPALHHICPACEMLREGLYEGVLYIRDIPKELYDQVISTILHEAVQYYIENPQHRLLEFSDVVDGYKVTATSAEMVRRLGQKMQSSFGTCEVRSTYQRDPFPMRINEAVFVTAEYF